MALNKWIGLGRLTADPDLKTTQNGIAVAKITVAVNRPYQKGKEQEADFIPVILWRGTAEFCHKHFSKGDPIQIEGRLQIRSYDDQNGNKRYVTEIQADNIAFVEGAKSRNDSNTGLNNDTFGFEAIDAPDDDLPF